MNVLDLPVVLDEFKVLRGKTYFTLIVPSTHAIGTKVEMRTSVNIVAFSQEDYRTIIQLSPEAKGVVAVGKQGFDVIYIRECSLRHVLQAEWKLHYGPNNMREYLTGIDTPDGVDGFVKIIFVKRRDPSLKELNKLYAKEKSEDD